MSRIKSRDLLFKLIFENFFHNVEDSVFYDEIIDDEDLSNESKDFINEMFVGINENIDELKNELSTYLVGYTIDRVYKVDLAILILALYEIKYYKKTPNKVVANECVELCKKYSTDKSYSFVNGVISKIISSTGE